jgi:hypothetical protein
MGVLLTKKQRKIMQGEREGYKMALITFVATADLDEIPNGQTDEFYALAMQKHIGETALDELDYAVKVY